VRAAAVAAFAGGLTAATLIVVHVVGSWAGGPTARTGHVAASLRPTARPSRRASTASPSPSAAASAATPHFAVVVAELSPGLRAGMTASGSWRPSCPVALDDLRLLTLSYWGFDGAVHRGHLVVNGAVARQIVSVFRRLFQTHYPIRRMVLVDHFGADEDRVMAADDTCGYNGRWVYGRPGVWSEHAFGKAVDINPLENPYVYSGKVAPETGRRYLDRTLRARGMIEANDAAVRAFASIGWGWGGSWASPDYMHFSASGK
jgi:hypothetical protein